MRTLQHGSKTFADELAHFCRSSVVSKEMADSVAGILADVRVRGDEAISYYAAKYDGAKLRGRDFAVKSTDLVEAAKRLPLPDRRALVAAHENIVDYNQRGLPLAWTAKNKHGANVGEKFDPIRRVGIYVPGGEVPLVSTVLMTVTLAKIAKCPEIVVFTPSNADGKVSDGILAALHMLGIQEIYRIGGVQAIGAMAHGTTTIRPVDKIYGPGNAYTCEAKRQVFGLVGVDSLPGPSEVMVIADESTQTRFAAADLVAQAEHGSGREKIYLVSTSSDVISKISSEIRTQLQLVTRTDKIQRVLTDGFAAIKVSTFAQAAEVANYVAPEHLELLVEPKIADELTDAITTAGAIMIGNYTPTALADFTAGPSHVLPTGRAGRFFSGLRVSDFLRRTSVVRYDTASVKKAEPTVSAFAAMERLDAHGRSVRIRTTT